MEASLSRTLCVKACSWAEPDFWGPEHRFKAQTQPDSSNFTFWAPLWQLTPPKSKPWTADIPEKGSVGEHVISWTPGDIQPGIHFNNRCQLFPFCPVLVRRRSPGPSLCPEHVYKIASVVSLALMGKRLDGVIQKCRITPKIPWLSTQHRHSPLFVSSDQGIWENIPIQRAFCWWGRQGQFWIMKARQILQRFSGSFLFPLERHNPWCCNLWFGSHIHFAQRLLQSEPWVRPV